MFVVVVLMCLNVHWMVFVDILIMLKVLMVLVMILAVVDQYLMVYDDDRIVVWLMVMKIFLVSCGKVGIGVTAVVLFELF
jgi:hypothetical protein